MSKTSVLHLVRAQRSAPPAPGDKVIAVDKEGRFYAPPGTDSSSGPLDARRVVAMVFEHDVVVVW